MAGALATGRAPGVQGKRGVVAGEIEPRIQTLNLAYECVVDHSRTLS